ncbi:aldo/keto reductase [Halopseudomonas pachastrellae]|nr:aldo/keto reductase [Halopseudomonas pachastrellae]
MQYRPLGRSNLKVSALCLGTMTWGEQNTQQEAFAQIDRARDAGVNFIDTAEMYRYRPRAIPTAPPKPSSATSLPSAATATNGLWPAK